MNIELVHNKEVLYEFLQKEAGLQIYLTGDLDDFFWPKTCWYALREKGKIRSVALLYAGMIPPTLLCFQKRDSHYAIRLLLELKPLLPARFYAHLGEGYADVFKRENIAEHYGLNYKMVLHKRIQFSGDNSIKMLGIDDLPGLLKLYSEAYPANWFDSRMLESGKYFGYIVNDELAGVAGIHVYSAKYKVAALGNITTHPEFRKQGIGYKLTAALCADLQQNVDVIGLNVRSDNEYAICLYKKLGFEVEGIYEECLIKNELST
ncbi:MAG: GNAT family N-acetyltransferase [Bacteroidota bacterium]